MQPVKIHCATFKHTSLHPVVIQCMFTVCTGATPKKNFCKTHRYKAQEERVGGGMMGIMLRRGESSWLCMKCELSCFLGLYEISLWDFLLFGSYEISWDLLVSFMLFWPQWDFPMGFHAFSCMIFSCGWLFLMRFHVFFCRCKIFLLKFYAFCCTVFL